jgi:ArsR family transcriptional regulator
MLAAARRRLQAVSNVELRAGTLEDLPVRTGELDAAVLSLVLHYTVEPAAVLAEAARALRPGGKLLIIDMLPHDREEYRARMGHVWLGFGREQLAEWLHEAGFDSVHHHALPADPAAKGPALFVASARRAADAAPRGNGRSKQERHSRATSRSTRARPARTPQHDRSR